MTTEALLLAIGSGVIFAVIAHWLWCWSAGKVAAVLLLVWITTTFAQQMLRIFSGNGGPAEMLTISELRLAQALAAIVTAGLLHGRCDE